MARWMRKWVSTEMGEKSRLKEPVPNTHSRALQSSRLFLSLFQWIRLYHSFWFVNFFAAFGDESDLIEKQNLGERN